MSPRFILEVDVPREQIEVDPALERHQVRVIFHVGQRRRILKGQPSKLGANTAVFVHEVRLLPPKNSHDFTISAVYDLGDTRERIINGAGVPTKLLAASEPPQAIPPTNHRAAGFSQAVWLAGTQSPDADSQEPGPGISPGEYSIRIGATIDGISGIDGYAVLTKRYDLALVVDDNRALWVRTAPGILRPMTCTLDPIYEPLTPPLG